MARKHRPVRTNNAEPHRAATHRWNQSPNHLSTNPTCTHSVVALAIISIACTPMSPKSPLDLITAHKDAISRTKRCSTQILAHDITFKSLLPPFTTPASGPHKSTHIISMQAVVSIPGIKDINTALPTHPSRPNHEQNKIFPLNCFIESIEQIDPSPGPASRPASQPSPLLIHQSTD
jgi:hypothetical protein